MPISAGEQCRHTIIQSKQTNEPVNSLVRQKFLGEIMWGKRLRGAAGQKIKPDPTPRVPVSARLERFPLTVRRSFTRNSALATALLLVLWLPALARQGAPELNELMSARESGLLTDWHIVGPFGLHPRNDFDRQWAPERDGVSRTSYGPRKVESFQFADGQVKLPPRLARDGVFYAVSEVYIHSAGDWRPVFGVRWNALGVHRRGESAHPRRPPRGAAHDSAQRLDALQRRSPRDGETAGRHRAFSPRDHGSRRRTAASSEHPECPRARV